MYRPTLTSKRWQVALATSRPPSCEQGEGRGLPGTHGSLPGPASQPSFTGPGDTAPADL